MEEFNIREIVDTEIMRIYIRIYTEAYGYVWAEERTLRVLAEVRRGLCVWDALEDEVVLYGTGRPEDDSIVKSIRGVLEGGKHGRH